jgi:hypothetical protein
MRSLNFRGIGRSGWPWGRSPRSLARERWGGHGAPTTRRWTAVRLAAPNRRFLVRGRRVTSVHRLGGTNQGRYVIRFDQNVSQCVGTVSISADVGTFGIPGFALAVPHSNTPDGFFVRTSSDATADVNQPFAQSPRALPSGDTESQAPRE